LTFGFQNATANSPEIDTQAEAVVAFLQGFSIWSQHLHINFRHSQNNPDILIAWGDPQCATYATACTSLPTDGDMIYDSEEVWAQTSPPPQGNVDIVAFACHEVGYALGLDDSDNEAAMMHGRIPNGRRRLIAEDVDDAVALRYRRR